MALVSGQSLQHGQKSGDGLHVKPAQQRAYAACVWRAFGGGEGGGCGGCDPMEPESCCASCTTCAMPAGSERRELSLSSSSDMAAPPRYCCIWLPKRFISAEPSGDCMTFFSMATIWAVLPLLAEEAA